MVCLNCGSDSYVVPIPHDAGEVHYCVHCLAALMEAATGFKFTRSVAMWVVGREVKRNLAQTRKVRR